MTIDGSELRGVSSAERTWDERTTGAMRKATPVSRRPRKKPERAQGAIASEFTCLDCGERFGPERALEFQKHVRAEAAEARTWRERRLARQRESNKRWREKERGDPVLLERARERNRKYRRRKSAGPEWRAEQAGQVRQRRASDPEYRARRLRVEATYRERHRDKILEQAASYRASRRVAAGIRPPVRRPCATCGTEFEPKQQDRAKYCSSLCKRKAAEQRLRVPAVCVICGAEYMQSRKGRGQTCSQKCRGQLRGQRARGVPHPRRHPASLPSLTGGSPLGP